MPIYEYICDNCAQKFEQILKIKDRNEAFCPKCGKKARKLMSLPCRTYVNFRFMDWGKPDKRVNYPDGHTRTKTQDEAFEEGD